jgi:hypothetical protein
MARRRAFAESSLTATRNPALETTMTTTRFNVSAFAAAFAVTLSLLLGVASMADQPAPDSYLATAVATHQPA